MNTCVFLTNPLWNILDVSEQWNIQSGIKPSNGNQGPLSGKTSYHQISRSLEAARLDVTMIASL